MGHVAMLPLSALKTLVGLFTFIGKMGLFPVKYLTKCFLL